MGHVIRYLHWLAIFAFIAIKVGGTALAAWSWWWILLSEVPILWLFLGKAGLLA
jgi:hypothetical protein